MRPGCARARPTKAIRFATGRGRPPPPGRTASSDQARNRRQTGLAFSAIEFLEALRWRGPALAAHLAAIGKCDAILVPTPPSAAPTIAPTDARRGPAGR